MLLWTIEPLHAGHAVEDVDCGDDALNRFLVPAALVISGPTPAVPMWL